jgi:hypothetical protein
MFADFSLKNLFMHIVVKKVTAGNRDNPDIFLTVRKLGPKAHII